MQIDCYGFDNTSVHFQHRKLLPYIIMLNGNYHYICFSNAEIRPIHRVTQVPETAETIIEWAYGRWEDAERLSYRPINETLEV